MNPFVHERTMASICLSLCLTHSLCVFYDTSFRWDNLKKSMDISKYYSNCKLFYKAISCFVFTLLCLLGHVSSFNGSILICFSAVPQLYRARGGRHLRIILGPLTLILSANNFLVDRFRNPMTNASGLISFLAFIVLRPDNDCMALTLRIGFMDAKLRRSLHGVLARANVLLALLSVLMVVFPVATLDMEIA